MSVTSPTVSESPGNRQAEDRLHEVLDLHLHPDHGSRFWLERQAELGWDIRDRVRSLADLPLLGSMEPRALASRSVWDFVPQSMQDDRSRFLTAETGGTTGPPVATVYSQEDFEAAFVAPFVRVAKEIGFPTGGEWLFIGPTGPHIIGKAQRRLAQEMGAPDPWAVDFDPRWVKRLVPGSQGALRYTEHVLAQATAILEREQVNVLFTTPPVLERLAQTLSDAQREQIRGVHYGGMAITAEQINGFKQQFPGAVHLSGYGNTLFGCALEVEDTTRQHVEYFPSGPRLLFDIIPEEDKDKNYGQLCFHRLDPSMLLVGVRERDWTTLIPVSEAAQRAGILQQGIRDPGPRPEAEKQLRVGIY